MVVAIHAVAGPVPAPGEAPATSAVEHQDAARHAADQGPAEPVLPVLEDLVPEARPQLEAALALAPRLFAAQQEVERAKGSRLERRAARLPSASFYGQTNLQRDEREGLSGDVLGVKLFYNVSVTQPLYHWGELAAMARQGDLDARKAQDALAEARRQLALEVRARFADLVVKRAQLHAAALTQARREAELAEVRDRISRGELGVTSELPPRLEAQQAGIDRDRAASELSLACDALARLTGGATPRPDQVPLTLPPIPERMRLQVEPWIDVWSAQASSSSSAVAGAERQVEMEDQQVIIARARLKPKLNVTAGIQQDEVNYTSDVANRSRLRSEFVGLIVNWQIFDGHATRGAVQEALARRRAAEQALASLTADVQAQVRETATRLGFAARELPIVETRRDATEAGLEFTREQIARGDATPDLAAQKEIDLANADVDVARARAEYLRLCGELRSALGRDALPAPVSSASPATSQEPVAP